MNTPAWEEYYNPVLQVLRDGGGTLTNAEIVDGVAKIMQLSDKVLNRMMNPPNHNMSVVAYRLFWVRTYLKKAGYITWIARGVWALTPKGKESVRVDPKALVQSVKRKDAARKKKKTSEGT